MDLSGQPLPTAAAFAVRRAIEALRAQNVSVGPLLRRAGLSEHDFAQAPVGPSKRRVSAEAQGKLLEYAAETVGDPAFGLHLAERSDPREVGLLFYVMSAAKDLGEALGLLARYCRIVNESAQLRLIRLRGGLLVEITFVGLPRHRSRQVIEFGVAAVVRAIRECVGRNVTLSRVAFAHPRNSALREFERFYGCEVEFSASADLLEFTADAIALPLVTADPHLLETLKPFCEQAASERSTAAISLRESVECEAQKLLPHGKAQAASVARALAMSERTLSRRLAEEGATYAAILDQLRRSLALQYVKEPGMSVSNIAWLLGYEGSTSFNHAFKRWTGRSPSSALKENRISKAIKQKSTEGLSQ